MMRTSRSSPAPGSKSRTRFDLLVLGGIVIIVLLMMSALDVPDAIRRYVPRADERVLRLLNYLLLGSYTLISASAIFAFRRWQDAHRLKEAVLATTTDLAASQAIYRRLVEDAEDLIFTTNLRGEITYFNPVAQRVFNLKSEEIIGRRYSMFVKPEQRREIELAFLLQLKEKTHNQYLEAEVVKDDGTTLWLGQNVHLLMEGEQAIGFEAVSRDITQRKKMERDLEVQKAYFEQLFENAPEAIALVDPGDVVLRVNKGFIAMFGYTADEAVGSEIQELIVPASERRDSVVLTTQVALGENVNLEAIRLRKDGTMLNASILATPINVGGGHVGVYVIYRDITERKLAEEERERLITELKEALANVKTLGALLPMCAWCKKIRDDGGYWSQVEEYLMGHSDTKLSHGICPECLLNVEKEFKAGGGTISGEPGKI